MTAKWAVVRNIYRCQHN